MNFVYVLILIAVIVRVLFAVYQKNAFKNFDYECYFDKSEVSEGDEVDLIEIVTNRKLMPLPWLKSEITTSKWLDFAGSQSLVTEETRFVPSFFMMKSFHKTVRRWHVKCLKRGVFTIDRVILVTTDLFGIASRSNTYHVNASLTVLPAGADLSADFDAAQKLSGDVIVRRHYIDDPFYRAGIKEYSPRDPINRIHWPATAKTGKLMVHNNQFSADQDLLVILNVQSRDYERDAVIDSEKIENGIRICAGYFEDTLRSGIPVRFAANTSLSGDRNAVITNSFHGAEHVGDLMQTLARIPLQSSDTFQIFLSGACRELTASDIVIVTSWLGEPIYHYARSKREAGSQVKIIYTTLLTDEYVPDDCAVFGYLGKERTLQ